MSATFPGLVHDAEVETHLFTLGYIFNTSISKSAGGGELVRGGDVVAAAQVRFSF